MSQLTKPLALALALGLAQGAWAQDTTAPSDTPAPAADATSDAAPAPAAPSDAAPAADVQGNAPAAAAPAPAAPQKPEVYTKATYGDWGLECIKTPNGKDPCQLHQSLSDPTLGPLGDIALFDVNQKDNEKVVAAGTIIVPLDVVLQDHIQLQVDTDAPKTYAYSFCQPNGCYIRYALTQEDLDAYKKGGKVTLSFVPLAAPNQVVKGNISLKGFTAGYEAMVEANKGTGADQ